MVEQLRSWKRKINYKDLLLKLISLALGILVWFLAVARTRLM